MTFTDLVMFSILAIICYITKAPDTILCGSLILYILVRILNVLETKKN